MGKVLSLDLEEQLQGGIISRPTWVGALLRIHLDDTILQK